MKNFRNKKNGAALITAVVFFLFISLSVVLGVATPAIRGVKIARGVEESKESFYTSESGQEDVVYRLVKGMAVSTSESLNLNGGTTNITISDVAGGKEVLSEGDKNSLIRTTKTSVLLGDGVTFNFGVQAGDGGFDIKNTASIAGNAFSNGPVTGANSNLIDGDVVSAGPNGSVDGVNVTGSAYSNSISNSDIGGDAYYQNITGSSVSGTSYSGSADQSTSTMPIEDSLIEEWKSAAEAGGVINSPCPYVLKKETETLGPVKINCDLEVQGSSTLYLTGHVWVAGDIDFSNTATINADPSMGGSSVAIIADNPSNNLTSGRIEATNSVYFNGSGNGNSYILLVSMNNSESNGGSERAIDAENNIVGDLLLYAPYGRIVIKNSVNLKEVTAYTIELQNTAQVIYESGLVNLLFTSGPAGGFTLNSWQEVE